VQRPFPQPYEVPVEVQHEEHVVQPIQVIEEPVVTYTQRVVSGAAYVAGQNTIGVVPGNPTLHAAAVAAGAPVPPVVA